MAKANNPESTEAETVENNVPEQDIRTDENESAESVENEIVQSVAEIKEAD